MRITAAMLLRGRPQNEAAPYRDAACRSGVIRYGCKTVLRKYNLLFKNYMNYMNRILSFFAISIMVCATSCSSTYSDEEQSEDQKKQELIIGKWVRPMQGQFHGYYIYRFRADGIGFEGRCYDDPNVLIPNNPDYQLFRYGIFNGEVSFCYYPDHTHSLQPGEICTSYGDRVQSFSVFVDDTFLNFAYIPSYTRVSQWSDVGLPDDLLPE